MDFLTGMLTLNLWIAKLWAWWRLVGYVQITSEPTGAQIYPPF